MLKRFELAVPKDAHVGQDSCTRTLLVAFQSLKHTHTNTSERSVESLRIIIVIERHVILVKISDDITKQPSGRSTLTFKTLKPLTFVNNYVSHACERERRREEEREGMINVVRSMEDRVQGQSFGSKESSKLENFSRMGIEHAFEPLLL